MTPINTITQGDCITAMTELDAASVDFVLTDPPYIVDYRSRDGRSVTNDDNSRWLRPAFSQIYRVLKPASFCVSFYAWNKVHLFMTAWRDAGFRSVGHIVFRKSYASSARFGRTHVTNLSGNGGRIGIDVERCDDLAAFLFRELFPWHGRVTRLGLLNTPRPLRRPMNGLDSESRQR